MLISEQYRELNKRLHNSNPLYGVSGQKYASIVRVLMGRYKCDTVLDYGCGKRTLERELGFEIANYDPAVPGYDSPPEPADLVVCTDVLEHVEPEMVYDVMMDIHRLAKRACLIAVHTLPAKKFLEDGRNSHLTVEGPHYWLQRLMPIFRVEEIQAGGSLCMCICTPKREH